MDEHKVEDKWSKIGKVSAKPGHRPATAKKNYHVEINNLGILLHRFLFITNDLFRASNFYICV